MFHINSMNTGEIDLPIKMKDNVAGNFKRNTDFTQ